MIPTVQHQMTESGANNIINKPDTLDNTDNLIESQEKSQNQENFKMVSKQVSGKYSIKMEIKDISDSNKKEQGPGAVMDH